jgi:hypothetical protein
MRRPVTDCDGADIGAGESSPWPESQATVCNLVPPITQIWGMRNWTPFSDRGVLQEEHRAI